MKVVVDDCGSALSPLAVQNAMLYQDAACRYASDGKLDSLKWI